MKRICSLLLALVMVLSLFPSTAQAAQLDNGLVYTVFNDHVEITDYFGDATELVIPDEIEGFPVTVIGEEAFYYCISLTSLEIGNSVTTIRDRAFFDCNNLRSVKIGNSVSTIGNHAFDACDSLSSVVIPESVTYIGDRAFYRCDSLSGIYVDANNLSYSSDDCGVLFDKHKTNLIQAPGTISGSYTIPNSVITIGHAAFYRCSSLNNVVIGNNVTSIGNEAFFVCDGLTSVVIPDSVTTIGEQAFLHCDNMIRADIGNSVTTIGEEAFARCANLSSIVIPDSVTSIGDRAFYDCTNLSNVEFGINVTTIGEEAFYNCDGLSSVEISNSVTTIGAQAFCACDSLIRVTIGISVTTIGNEAFSCTNLSGIYVDVNNPSFSNDEYGVLYDKHKTNLIQAPGALSGSYSIPNSVITIGDDAFAYCANLSSIVIPNSVTSIGNQAFYSCETLSRVVIPDSVTSIGYAAFSFCDALNSVVIPDSVTFIDYAAFCFCGNLSNVEIGNSVTFIGYAAFYACDSLTNICFNGNVPDLGEDVFYDVTATAYYPAGNPTWTADVMQNYGGNITWIPHNPANPFTDVPFGSWFEAPVLWALENGVTSGSSETTFSPGDKCLRAHVVTFLWNAEKTPEPTAYTKSFSDVPAGAWYYKPVHWAVEHGITSGVSDTKFGAGDVCSRYQVVFFLWKAAGSPEPKTTVNPFTDVNPGHFFYKAVLWAVENGITSGTSATTFGPTAPCNRAQVVTFLYAAYN